MLLLMRSLMANPVQLLHTSPFLPNRPLTTQFKTFTSQHPLSTLSLKEICGLETLKEAFQALTISSNPYTSINFHQDETYAPILELCARKNALFQGLQIHAHMIKSFALRESVFLGTKLVFMYGKSGSLEYAEKVFDGMRQRTVFTWNAMIGAYVANGKPYKALETYREMRVLEVPLDACTFPGLLKACGMVKVKDLNLGAEVHGLAIKFGYDSTVFVANSLVAMYAKCDEIDGARRLFDRMPQQNDVVSWNSIISAYSANGKSMEALRLFRDMQSAGVETNTYTFIAALQACEDKSFRKVGMEIHAAVLKSNRHVDVYVANALIAMYIRCGEMAEAVAIFDELDEKDIVSWNSMLTGFIQNGMYSEALQFFHEFQEAGWKPDNVSFVSIIAACGRLGNLLNGKEMHAYTIKHELDSDLLVGNTLIDMYSKCCNLNYMARAFDRIPDKDSISWTTIIAAYAPNNFRLRALDKFREVRSLGMDVDAMMIGSILPVCSSFKCMSQVKEIHGYVLRRGISDIVLRNIFIDTYGESGNMDYAMRTFKSIEFKDVVSWTSMISAYVNNGFPNEALQLFRSMNQTIVQTDSVALITVLSASASLSALKKGKEIHGFLVRKGFSVEGFLATSLVDMYSHCGMVENACKVFNSVLDKGLALWTSMINAHGMHGRGRAAIDLFNKMEAENIIPDHVAFLALLYACSHSGLISEGKRLFDVMRYYYRLEPWPEHYACLVDLLGRANQLEEAYEFVKSMPTKPTAEVWCALLGACQVHSNNEVADLAADKLLELEPENPGHYVLISNVFSARGRWKDAEELRTRMKGGGLKKNPGCSWIEVENKIHTFMAREKSHPEYEEIDQKLAEITKTLESEGGYIAQTKFVLHNLLEESEKVKMLHRHSERLAISYGLLKTRERTPIRITKNLRVCGDCHNFCKLVSRFYERDLIIRDANRFHHFKDGVCSCGDFW